MLLWCKIAEKGECSAPLSCFNFLSKPMRAVNCVLFCLNPFCLEVNDGCLPHDEYDSGQNFLLVD